MAYRMPGLGLRRDARERIIRARSQYYYKRSLGVSCRDLLTRQERDRFEHFYGERLAAAWQFVEALADGRVPLGRARGV
jgi:hypothetical protein